MRVRAVAMFRLVATITVVGVLVGAVGTAPLSTMKTVLEKFELPSRTVLPRSSIVLDVHGDVVATLAGEVNRRPIPRSEMPQHLLDAVVVAEDRRFFEHSGVSVRGIARAAVANLRSGRVVQGGSTITQQYVRTNYDAISLEQTARRKAIEALLAIRAEQRYSKAEILERYLNAVYLGRGAYGVEAASRAYFRKPAKRLELHEAAFLAAIIQAPEQYASDLDSARARRDMVLRNMVELGHIGAKKARAAIAEDVDLAATRTVGRAPYFVEFVRRLLKAPKDAGGFGLSDEQIYTGGLRIHTTLDLSMQQAADRAVRAVLPRRGDPEVGFVAMTTSGEIRAMVGGKDTRDVERARGFNFAAQQSQAGGRQAGSTFKPFALAAFLRDGYSARSRFRAPSRIAVEECSTPGRGPWKPANYGNNSYGRLSLIRATELSVNTVYAQVAAIVGPKEIAKAARDAGIMSPLSNSCSLTLGTSGVTPLEMARAYATFAARGMRPDVVAVRKIEQPAGDALTPPRPKRTRAFKARIADTINAILRRVMVGGTGRPAAISRPAAGKTGTTENKRDLWFVGYTPHPGLSAAVWVGHPLGENGRIKPVNTYRGRPATGGGVAGSIWRRFMTAALEESPEARFRRVAFTGKMFGASRRQDRDASSDRDSEGSENDGDERRAAPTRREREPSDEPERAPKAKPKKKKKKERRSEPEHTTKPDPAPEPETTEAPEPPPEPEPSEAPDPPSEPEPSDAPDPPEEPDPEPEPEPTATGEVSPEPDPEPETTSAPTSSPDEGSEGSP